MRVRTETTDELAGFVEAMRARVLVVDAPDGAIDTCGTGGDVHGTFNISTATSLVTAAAGVPVAKHGNRAVSSQSGSSDAIASLGLTVEQTVDAAEASLRETATRTCTRRRSIRACVTRARCGASWGSAPRSTCAARWPTRRSSSAS